MVDITSEEGRRITQEALSWKGTEYALVGAKSVKGHSGDCSGTTWAIFNAAGYPYPYQSAGTFSAYAVTSRNFRKLKEDEVKQDGDILYWDDHIAIYSTFSSKLEAPFRTTPRINKKGQPWTQTNDMWTASHPGGAPYGPGIIKFWKSTAPDFYRYVKQ